MSDTCLSDDSRQHKKQEDHPGRTCRKSRTFEQYPKQVSHNIFGTDISSVRQNQHYDTVLPASKRSQYERSGSGIPEPLYFISQMDHILYIVISGFHFRTALRSLFILEDIEPLVPTAPSRFKKGMLSH